MRIAIVGAGITGLSAAYALRERHDIVLFEQQPGAGGHTHTVGVPTRDGTLSVDMGFIVYNRPTYPMFAALLDELDVATQPTEMTFGHRCHRCDLEFGSVGIGGFLAQPDALVRRSHWRMVGDLRRFYRDARHRLDEGAGTDDTLADLLDAGGYGAAFRDHFLVPVVSAIWSSAAADVATFPAGTLLRFLDNHGLIGFRAGKPWRTIVGGSDTYVRRILGRLPAGALRPADSVIAVRRDGSGVTVRTGRGSEGRFDRVIMATHADTARDLLVDADLAEAEALGRFEYTSNEVVLHTDDRLLPRRSRARGSWNVDTVDCRQAGDRLTMTYDMARLQRLATSEPCLVSVNPGHRLRPDRIIAVRSMSHPRYTFRTLDGQRALSRLQGHRHTWYAGAHLGYGFHEDGCRSGFEAAAAIESVASRVAA